MIFIVLLLSTANHCNFAHRQDKFAMAGVLSDGKIESYYNCLQDYLLFRLHHKLSDFHYDYHVNGAVMKLFDTHRQWPLSVRRQLHKIAEELFLEGYDAFRGFIHPLSVKGTLSEGNLLTTFYVCVHVAKYYALRGEYFAVQQMIFDVKSEMDKLGWLQS